MGGGGNLASCVLCCAIGVGLWVAVAYFTGYELGIIAWALGGLAGAGMAVGARTDNTKRGLTAGVVALVALVTAKVIMAYVLVPASIVGLLDRLGVVLSPHDFLWALFSFLTAFRIGKGRIG